ncbi:MAG: T9SS type A sorting domain-containing protein [Candidatus Zixiibacteriota bacterium]
MRTSLTAIWVTLIATVALSTAAWSRDLETVQASDKTITDCSDSSMTTWSDFCPGLWPWCVGVQSTKDLRASFNSYGQLGTGYSWCGRDIFGCTVPSFETPPYSHNDYLFSGAVWIGGIVGNDTLVSVAADGWYQSREFYPANGPTRGASITQFRSHLGTSLRSEATDTFTVSVPGIILDDDWLTGRPHIPLGVRVVLRSHTLDVAPYDQTVLYDLIVSNINSHTIHDGYAGLFFDADVYNRTIDLPPNGYRDDAAGSLKDQRIAYIIDNDGDPVDNAFDAPTCVPRAFAVKILRTSVPFADTNFNWWISNGNPTCDFGPRQKADSFDFGTGGIGTPVGDRNKYHILSYPEWDYDEVLISTIDSTDPVWRYPIPTGPTPYGCDSDVRMLISVGPFELPPDSSIVLQFATFTGSSIHHIPDNLDNLAVDPNLYLANLNLDQLIDNAARSDTLTESLLIPTTPVSGLTVAYRDRDSVVLTWDPWPFGSEVTGYNIYVAEVPDSALPYPGIVPPWYMPGDYHVHARVGRVSRYRIRGLDPDRFYALNISTRVACKSGELGAPVFVPRPDDRPAAPTVTCSTLIDGDLFVAYGEPFTLEFSPTAGTEAMEYHVYRFESTAQASSRRLPYYSCSGLDSLIPLRDSFLVDGQAVYYYAMVPYAVVSADVARFTDTAMGEGMMYVLSAVDSAGIESNFSAPIVTCIPESRTRDILVVTKSVPSPAVMQVAVDTIRQFYQSILQGYDFDFYFLYDTTVSTSCPSRDPNCLDWRDLSRYRLVIIDDGMKDAILSPHWSVSWQAFQRYSRTGGTLAYFGGFSPFRRLESAPIDGFVNLGWEEDLVESVFGVDSVMGVPYYYYWFNNLSLATDSLLGFNWAEPLTTGIPASYYDTTRYPFLATFQQFWPRTSAPAVAVFKPVSGAEPIHVYRSLYPPSSLYESETVGLRFKPIAISENTTYTFGFHLWYMQPDQARDLIHWILPPTPTDLADEEGTLPERFLLAQNYPNPFNPTTTISYSLSRKSHVTLEIFNILGQRVRTLLNEEKPSGTYRIEWGGDDDARHKVSTGIYLYRLKTDQETISKKMLLLK